MCSHMLGCSKGDVVSASLPLGAELFILLVFPLSTTSRKLFLFSSFTSASKGERGRIHVWRSVKRFLFVKFKSCVYQRGGRRHLGKRVISLSFVAEEEGSSQVARGRSGEWLVHSAPFFHLREQQLSHTTQSGETNFFLYSHGTKRGVEEEDKTNKQGKQNKLPSCIVSSLLSFAYLFFLLTHRMNESLCNFPHTKIFLFFLSFEQAKRRRKEKDRKE